MLCLRVSSSGAQSKAESEDAPQTTSEDNVVANGVQVGPWQWLGAGCSVPHGHTRTITYVHVHVHGTLYMSEVRTTTLCAANSSLA